MVFERRESKSVECIYPFFFFYFSFFCSSFFSFHFGASLPTVNSERKRMKRNGEMTREIRLEKQQMLFMPFCSIDFTYVPERIAS